VDVASEGYDAIIPAMISKLPTALIGLVMILVLSASMSTLSSLVLTSSSTLTLDLLRGHIVKKMENKHQLLVMRVLVVFFVAISAVIAILQFKYGFAFIAQMMGLSWGALAGAFLAPFLYGLWWKRTTAPAVWACFAFGCVNMILNMFVPAIYPAWLASPINCGAFTMLVGLIIVPVISLLTPKPDAAKTEEIFSCYAE
jgi:SSS family solute:Na+ symporter